MNNVTPPRSQNILITGGLGFIGTHLASAYIDAGHSVTLLDSMVAAVNDGSMFGDQSRVRILKTTIENFFSASGGINSYDTVIHAA